MPLYVYYPYHLSGLLGDGTDEYISGLKQHHRKLQEHDKRLMMHARMCELTETEKKLREYLAATGAVAGWPVAANQRDRMQDK